MSANLECVDVTILLGGSPIVENVTLTIAAGEYHVLLGPSGSGKTTLLRSIAGLERVRSGNISIGGSVVSSAGTHAAPESRGVSLVFQNLALWPQWSAARQIEEVLKLRGVPRTQCNKKASELLELVHLRGMEKRAIFELSGGEAQRLAIARALASQPRILLMDEPLGSVDETLRFVLSMELRELQRKLNLTVLHVTHDQKEGIGLADAMTILHKGRVEQTGVPEQMIDKPATRFAAEFIGKYTVFPAEAQNGTLVTPVGNFACGKNLSGAVQAAVRPEAVRFSSNGVAAKIVWKTRHPGGWFYYLSAGGIQIAAYSAESRVAGENVFIQIDGAPLILPIEK